MLAAPELFAGRSNEVGPEFAHRMCSIAGFGVEVAVLFMAREPAGNIAL